MRRLKAAALAPWSPACWAACSVPVWQRIQPIN